MNVIDLRPLVDGVVFPIITAVSVPLVAGFVTWALARIGKLTKVQINANMEHAVEVAMQNGIDFAISRAQTEADKHGTAVVKSAVVASAVNYVVPKVPGALKQLNITPEGLAQRIEARLHSRAADPTDASVPPLAS